MTNVNKPYRMIAAVLGALETVALLMAVIALLSMGGDGLDRLLAAFAFYIFLPVAAVIGIFLGIKFGRSASPWAFGRPRQVIISVIVAVLLLGLNEHFQDRGRPTKDPFVSASSEQIVQFLRDPQPENRSRAAEELVQRHYPAAGDLILPLLKDGSGSVRGRAAVLLGQLRDKRAVDRIVMLLDDPDYGTQIDAVRGLGEMGERRAVAPLLAALHRPNFSGIIADALAKIGDQRAVGPLIDYLENTTKEDEVKYRNWVISSLEKLSGQKLGNDIVRWRQWYESEGKK
jgi:HEAT repeats/PBS lyase HEAT-like repeat